jgi:hypothetical protein
VSERDPKRMVRDNDGDARTFDRAFDDAVAAGHEIEETRALHRSIWVNNPNKREELSRYLQGDTETWFGDRPVRSGRQDSRLADVTYEELVADSALLDRVVRAICLERDCDYVTALDELERWHDQADLTGDSEDVAFDKVLDCSPLSLDRLQTDVMALERDDDEQHEAIALSRDVTPAPEGEVTEHGQVKLADHVDRARLLTDSYEFECAYLEVRELSHYADGDEGRREFEADYRAHVEAGLDLVGTLQLARHRDEAAHKEGRASAAQAAREGHEREKRARRRRASEEIRAKLEEL